jgi:hypothetical protein
MARTEMADAWYLRDRGISLSNIRTARGLIEKIRKSKTEMFLTSEGWKYVIHDCTVLGIKVFDSHDDEMSDIVGAIVYQAIIWRDEAISRESGTVAHLS